jgi:hypothetical protein
MTKSLRIGIAVFATLALFAGNADARRAHIHKTHKTIIRSTTATRPTVQYGPLLPPVQYYPLLPPEGPWSWSIDKGGPLHDCVHIAFPQCSPHGPDGPNDY